MSNILRNLRLEEFSIVRGSDKQPANPGAKVLAYKTTQSDSKEPLMDKEKLAALQKTLPQKIGDAVMGVLKSAQVVTRVSEYSSQSRSTDTFEDSGAADPAPAGESGSGATVIVVDATQKTEAAPTQKTAPAQPAAEDLGTVISKAITAGMAPVMAQVDSLSTRMAGLENSPAGSRAIGKASNFLDIQSNAKASQFGEFAKFLAQVSGISPGQKLSKATLSSAGWTYGLSFAEAGAFIDYIVDQSVLMKKVRTVKMPNLKHAIDKIGLGGKVLVKGTPGTDPGDTVSLSGPTQVLLTAKEILAIVSIGDDSLEDNIEGDAFAQHLLTMIGAAGANEIEQAAIHGDTGTADTGIMDRWDGWLKLAIAGGAHVIEAMADADRYWPGTNGGKATRLIKSIPTKYRQDFRNLAMILHNDLYLDYQDELASKGYSEAWQAITGMADVPIRSIQNVRVPMLKTDISFSYSATPYTDGTVVMLTDLRNLIVGMHREIRIEPFRQPRKRCTDYVISLRADVQIENGDAIAIYNHAKVKA
jgi:hypothetical protein